MTNEEKVKRDIKSLKVTMIMAVVLLIVSIITCVVSSLNVSDSRPDYNKITAKVVDVRTDVELSYAKYGKTDSTQVVIVSYKGKDTKLIGTENIKWYVDAFDENKEVPVYEYQGELYATPGAIKSATIPIKVRGISILMILFSLSLTISVYIALSVSKRRQRNFGKAGE